MAEKAKSYGFIESLRGTPRGGATARVIDVLREAIVSLELKPGDPIDKTALCARLGVSRFPVSEALSRLESEGLVDIQPQRGTSVALIRLADARQNTFLRRALEAETVRRLAGRPLPSGLDEALSRNLRYQRAAVEADDRKGFYGLDLAFHDLLLSALDFPRVKAAAESARLGLDRVRRLLASPRRNAISLAEHEKIHAALTARQGEAAARAMQEHIDAVLSELEDHALANPGLYADGAGAPT